MADTPTATNGEGRENEVFGKTYADDDIETSEHCQKWRKLNKVQGCDTLHYHSMVFETCRESFNTHARARTRCLFSV